jgi:hypothetical protein
MADPILPGVIRTQVVFQNANAMPTDRYVTTWAFKKVTGTVNLAVQGAAILTAMASFFNDATDRPATLASYLGPQISRVANTAHVISYDLGTTPPRHPFDVQFTLGAGSSSSPLPAEVACCLSLKTSHLGPRGKGRVYIGPFNGAAVGTAEAGDARPVDALRTTLKWSAQKLRDSAVLIDAGLVWHVVSHSDSASYPVSGGFIDNAWDTHRSRGLDPSARQLW